MHPAFHTLLHLIFTLTQAVEHHCSDFTDGETEAQRSYVTCLRSYSRTVEFLGWEPRFDILQRPPQPDAELEQRTGEGFLPGMGPMSHCVTTTFSPWTVWPWQKWVGEIVSKAFSIFNALAGG